MVENIKLKIVDSHEEILGLIDRNVGTLANFDCHSGYQLYQEKTLDVDSYSSVMLNYHGWLDNNWVPVLVSRGYLSQYIWFYPHDCAKDDVKIFKSKKGDCLVYNIRFNGRTKMSYRHITIDMDFLGCKIPIYWNPDDRKQLFMNILGCLTAKNVILVISKSKRYVNYDVDGFLDGIIKDISNIASIEVI